MWQDSIVKETRKLRKQYGEKFKHDPDAIFVDICIRQEKSERKRVAFPARRAKSKKIQPNKVPHWACVIGRDL